jgi:hypothetical protein
MKSTGLDHRLVRDYLRDLDAALVTLPAEHARELRLQITAHLDEALRPGMDDEGVAAELDRLGTPADLAAEAGAATPVPLSQAIKITARARLGRVSGYMWIRAGLALAIIGIVASYLVYYLAAGSLEEGPQSLWWYPQDAARFVITTADGATQYTVPIRRGQRQGFEIGIYNPTDVTQTVVGAPDVPGVNTPAAEKAELAVSDPNRDVNNGGTTRKIRFTLPAAIAPHQLRLLRIMWVSDACESKGAATIMDEIYLRVRVGWFTKTETIPLDEGWAVSGTSQSECH